MNRWLVTILTAIVISVLQTTSSHATSQSLVISQVQVGGAVNVSEEFIELFNTADIEVDVSNFCVDYNSVTDATKTRLACLTPPDNHTKLFVKAKGTILLTSTDLSPHTGIISDDTFAGVMSGSGGGHVRLLNSSGVEMDKLGYGSAAKPEMVAAPLPAGGQSLVRTAIGQTRQDTDNNAADFHLSAAPVLRTTSALYEVDTTPPPVDVCSNIAGIQTILPTGYVFDLTGSCQVDVCRNLNGLQISIPAGYEINDVGNCIQPLESATIMISELLPNPAGTDTGHEYIELYNPNDHTINLAGYTLWVGPNFDKSYVLPLGTSLDAGQYVALTDGQLGFSLVNTTSRVRLVAPASNIVSETPSYDAPGDNIAWAIVGGEWQLTNQPTQGSPNLASVVATDDGSIGSSEPVTLPACSVGKYRNPLTNRCRTIEFVVSDLMPCNEDEYRNLSTNRCRKTSSASTTLTTCQSGYERNSDTNRCRKTGDSSATLAPCTAGQERNPETNRCRKIVASAPAVLSSATKSQDPREKLASDVQGWVLGLIGAGVIGYGIFEWRHEILGATARVGRFIGRK